MIDIGVIITGVIGIITTILGSWGSWFFTRRKYNSEVDNSIIQGMQASLEFYKKLSDDNKNRLDEKIQRIENLEQQVNELKAESKELRTQLYNLMNSICTDLSCQVRRMDFSTLDID